MLYRNRSNCNIIKHYNDSSNIYEIFNNTKTIEKHYNKQLHYVLVNSNLNDLSCIRNIKSTKNRSSFSFWNPKNEIKNKIRIHRKKKL